MLRLRLLTTQSRSASSSTLESFSNLLPKGALSYVNGWLKIEREIERERERKRERDRERGSVAGGWLEAKSKKTFDVFNPYSNELLCKTTDLTVDDTKLVREFMF